MWAKRECYTEGLFFFFLSSPPPSYGRFLRRTATPGRDFQGRMSPLSAPRVSPPARAGPAAACWSDPGHCRRHALSPPAGKKTPASSWKIFTWFNHAVYFPKQNRALPKHSLRLRHGGRNCSLSNSCKLYLLKMRSFSHLRQTPTAEHHS